MPDASNDSRQSAFRLIYRSHSKVPPDRRKAALGAIFSAARSNNKANNITGALLVSDDSFVQVLEGDEAAVRALYERIRSDSRHAEVSLIDTRTVDGRVFGRWAMAKVAADGEPDIPLITNRDKGGAVPAANRATTADQDAVLDLMREAIRGESQPV